MTTVIVDYGRGNIFSLAQALRHIGVTHEVSADAERIAMAERLILPGVGAFGDAMAALGGRNLVDPIRRAVARGIPLLGICLGMQLLADRSEEFGTHEGLGIIPGEVRHLPKGEEIRIPNVGWRYLTMQSGGKFLEPLPKKPMAYFVHSFGFVPANPADTVATISVNSHSIAAIVRRGNVVGYQFHPEKSGEMGLSFLNNFMQFSRVDTRP